MDNIDHLFAYHKPDEIKQTKHELVRDQFRSLAQLVNAQLPDGREKSLVITKLQEALMWANAGIALAKS